MKADRFEREYKEATRRGKLLFEKLPKADSARFDRKTKRLVLDLKNSSTLLVPTKLIQGLEGASDKEIADFELMLGGSQIHWRGLDIQLYIKSLIEGVFGTRSWMDRLREHYAAIGGKGGAARTSAKVAASRENGKKGGRPRKVPLSR
ncbi:MAG TPA: DUF2442 domain-containing protein [Pyrinomonadaceae bacterium]|nr:DUF2442 domain-containing protein [Pyrinomonadaceae bacterium]